MWTGKQETNYDRDFLPAALLTFGLLIKRPGERAVQSKRQFLSLALLSYGSGGELLYHGAGEAVWERQSHGRRVSWGEVGEGPPRRGRGAQREAALTSGQPSSSGGRRKKVGLLTTMPYVIE